MDRPRSRPIKQLARATRQETSSNSAIRSLYWSRPASNRRQRLVLITQSSRLIGVLASGGRVVGTALITGRRRYTRCARQKCRKTNRVASSCYVADRYSGQATSTGLRVGSFMPLPLPFCGRRNGIGAVTALDPTVIYIMCDRRIRC